MKLIIEAMYITSKPKGTFTKDKCYWNNCELFLLEITKQRTMCLFQMPKWAAFPPHNFKGPEKKKFKNIFVITNTKMEH